MSSRIAILAFGVLLIGIVAALFVSTQPPPIWSEGREPGTSVEGHWYPVRSGGCFADAAVFRIESDREVVISRGIALTFGADLISTVKDGMVTLEMEIPLRRSSPEAARQYAPAHFEYRDLGSKLEVTRFEQGGSTASSAELPVADLRRCGDHSLWARLSLLWRPGFVVGEADEVVDPRRL